MTAARTADLITRMPAWFIEQVRALDAHVLRGQLDWEETRCRANALARCAPLGLLCAIGVRDDGRDEWQDTVSEVLGR